MIKLLTKSNSIIAVIALLALATFSSCESSTHKVETAKNNVTEAKEKLTQAQEDYQTQVEFFKKESNEKITENKKIIADLKSKMSSVKRDSQEDYRKQIALLEEKNEQIRIRLEAYKYDGKENWESFKIDFNHDMKLLGNSIKDAGRKNNN